MSPLALPWDCRGRGREGWGGKREGEVGGGEGEDSYIILCIRNYVCTGVYRSGSPMTFITDEFREPASSPYSLLAVSHMCRRAVCGSEHSLHSIVVMVTTNDRHELTELTLAIISGMHMQTHTARD